MYFLAKNALATFVQVNGDTISVVIFFLQLTSLETSSPRDYISVLFDIIFALFIGHYIPDNGIMISSWSFYFSLANSSFVSSYIISISSSHSRNHRYLASAPYCQNI